MTSREAFEAWADARDATHAGKLRSEIAGFDYPLGRVLDECWQAAIQHARDEAEDCIEHELGETGQAKAIVHAIKEALK